MSNSNSTVSATTTATAKQKNNSSIPVLPEKTTEDELLQHLSKYVEKKLIWDETSSEWFFYGNGKWVKRSHLEISDAIYTVLKQMIPKANHLTSLNKMERGLKILLHKNNWKTPPQLLPMKNGVLDISTMKLLSHESSFYFKWALPYDYDPKATCPTIMNWLNESTNNNSIAIEAIRAAIYSALFFNPDTQKFMEIVGAGGTGKSTLVRLIQLLVGSNNYCSTDLKQLESNKFETAALYGKRVAFINDSSRYGGDVNVLKALTGGDPVRLEKKNIQQGESFLSEAFIFIISNEAIQSTDYTSGLSRRRFPIYFNRQVSDADKAKWKSKGGIEQAMEMELSGMLNWVIGIGKQGAISALGGIGGNIDKTSLLHLIDTNDLAAWFEERCILNPEGHTYTGGKLKSGADALKQAAEIQNKLFPNYLDWMSRNNNGKALSVNIFGKHLEDLLANTLKFPVKRLNRDMYGRAFDGISIRSIKDLDILTPILKEKL